MRPPLLFVVTWALGALLLAACGSDTGVRIVAATGTPDPPAAASPPAGAAASEATASPTPVPVELPARPENPFAGGVGVARYLAGGRADLDRCLPELVRAWELSDVDGERCELFDLDGDGREELLFLVTLPGDPQSPGEVWFFDDAESGYRFFSSARALANDVLSDVELLGVADLTGDGTGDAVITSRDCGTQPCSTRLLIASAHRGALEDLTPPGTEMPSMESAEIVDADQDGLPDVVMKGGGTGDSAAAGPQRGVTRTLSYTGLRFARVDRPDEPEYLIHQIADADSAFRAGDYERARELYRRAATDTGLRDWKAENGEFAGRREIVPYAWFRAGLAAQRQGDGDAMRDLLRRAVEGFTGSMHGIAAAIYLEAVDEGRPPGTACSAAEQYLQRFADAYARFWDYGYANPERTIDGLCR